MRGDIECEESKLVFYVGAEDTVVIDGDAPTQSGAFVL